MILMAHWGLILPDDLFHWQESGKKKHININKCAALSRDWVGGIICLCDFVRRNSLWGRKTHKQNPPKTLGQSRENFVYVFFLAPKRRREHKKEGKCFLLCSLAFSSPDWGSGLGNPIPPLHTHKHAAACTRCFVAAICTHCSHIHDRWSFTYLEPCVADPEVPQSRFGGELFMLVWRTLGSLPANFWANSLANFSLEFCGLVSPEFQEPPPRKCSLQMVAFLQPLNVWKQSFFTPISAYGGDQEFHILISVAFTVFHSPLYVFASPVFSVSSWWETILVCWSYMTITVAFEFFRWISFVWPFSGESHLYDRCPVNLICMTVFRWISFVWPLPFWLPQKIPES